MRNGLKILSVVLVIILVLAVIGCSRQAGPKDADAIKAIQSTIEGSPKGVTLKSPIVILERGKQLPGGDWPIKVEYTVAAKDGSTKKEVMTYNLSPSIDAMGANIWLAAETK